MKIKVNVDFVMDITVDEDAFETPLLSPIMLKPLMLASAAKAFEDMFQVMLIQVPEMLKAEVTHIEEYND